MQKKLFFPMTLIAVALFSGCSSMPPQNASLTEAHDSYNSARSSTQVTSLAPVELKEAGDTLSKADKALSQGESEASVNQLAYVANQQVAIARETARRKAAELDVANASAKRDQIRLEARTAEADVAKQQVAAMQGTADQQAAALAAASANAQRDQASLEARTAEADVAKQQVAAMQGTADQQAAALAAASAKTSTFVPL